MTICEPKDHLLGNNDSEPVKFWLAYRSSHITKGMLLDSSKDYSNTFLNAMYEGLTEQTIDYSQSETLVTCMDFGEFDPEEIAETFSIEHFMTLGPPITKTIKQIVKSSGATTRDQCLLAIHRSTYFGRKPKPKMAILHHLMELYEKTENYDLVSPDMLILRTLREYQRLPTENLADYYQYLRDNAMVTENPALMASAALLMPKFYAVLLLENWSVPLEGRLQESNARVLFRIHVPELSEEILNSLVMPETEDFVYNDEIFLL